MEGNDGDDSRGSHGAPGPRRYPGLTNVAFGWSSADMGAELVQATSGHRTPLSAGPLRADSVEKVCLRTRRNFLRVVGAVFRERRGGPHGAQPSESKTSVVDLRR